MKKGREVYLLIYVIPYTVSGCIKSMLVSTALRQGRHAGRESAYQSITWCN